MTDKSAFPHDGIYSSIGEQITDAQPGMTFREWQWTLFAAAAIAGLRANPLLEYAEALNTFHATEACRQADAMMAAIAEREKQS